MCQEVQCFTKITVVFYSMISNVLKNLQKTRILHYQPKYSYVSVACTAHKSLHGVIYLYFTIEKKNIIRAFIVIHFSSVATELCQTLLNTSRNFEGWDLRLGDKDTLTRPSDACHNQESHEFTLLDREEEIKLIKQKQANPRDNATV